MLVKIIEGHGWYKDEIGNIFEVDKCGSYMENGKEKFIWTVKDHISHCIQQEHFQAIEEVWKYNLCGSEIWTCSEEFDTKEEAIEFGIKEAKELEIQSRGHDFIEVGQVEKYQESGIDGVEIIERLIDNACDEVGEVAEDYMSEVTPQQTRELEEEINEVIEQWIERHNLQASFYKIINVEKIQLD